MSLKCPSCKTTKDSRKVSAIISEQSGLTASAKRKWFQREYSTQLAKQLKKPLKTDQEQGLGYLGCGFMLLLAFPINLLFLGWDYVVENLAGGLIVVFVGLALFIVGLFMRREAAQLRKDAAINDYFYNLAASKAWYCSKCDMRFDENGELD